MSDFLDLLMLPFIYVFDVQVFTYLFEIAYAIILLGLVWRFIKLT